MSVLKGDFVYRAPPIVVNSARGSRIYSDTREYVDLQASSGASILGYDNSILSSIDLTGTMLSKPQTCESETRLRVADILRTKFQAALGKEGRIGFELGGAQGIELALKVAIAARPKFHLVTIEGAYHGRSLFTSHLSSSRRYVLGMDPQFRHQRLPNPVLMAEGGTVDKVASLEQCIQHVKQIFRDERFGFMDPHGSVPIFVFETVQNVAGMLDIPASYLQAIEECVREAGGVTIADEIFTGMYRLGGFCAHVSKGLKPDIVVMSKGLTNGLVPLSIIWVGDDSGLSETFRPGTHSCTYINNELALLTLEAVLRRLASIPEIENLAVGARLHSSIAQHVPEVAALDAFATGNVLRLNFPTSETAKRFSELITEHAEIGVLHATTGLAKSSVIFHPAYVIGEEDIAASALVCAEAMKKLERFRSLQAA
ncbi:aminotransferase class III-fold pyridoxal phosphate-dependent enzyme [Ensifer sp. ENS05]|nr:aminotransferase class III-fold pyridoxal phosphate-dependent enzyme [Ensifer sp. ENS05]